MKLLLYQPCTCTTLNYTLTWKSLSKFFVSNSPFVSLIKAIGAGFSWIKRDTWFNLKLDIAVYLTLCETEPSFNTDIFLQLPDTMCKTHRERRETKRKVAYRNTKPNKKKAREVILPQHREGCCKCHLSTSKAIICLRRQLLQYDAGFFVDLTHSYNLHQKDKSMTAHFTWRFTLDKGSSCSVTFAVTRSL